MTRVLPKISAGEGYGTGLDIKGNGLLVSLPTKAKAEEFRSSYDGDIPVSIIVGADMDQNCTSRYACDSPQRAGVALRGPNGNCSSGYVVRTTTGNEMLTTAGHCWLEYILGTVLSGNYYLMGTLTNQNTLAQYSSPEADARLIETPNLTTYNYLYHSNSNKSRVVGQKKGYYSTNTGTMVCLYAYPWNDTSLAIPNCGQVDYVEYAYYESACGCTVRNTLLADYGSVGGTSGGAVGSANGYTAVGIHSGDSSGYGRFSHIEKVDDYLRVTLSTSP